MERRKILILVMAAGALIGGLRTEAQQPRPDGRVQGQVFGGSPLFWNADTIIQPVVAGISRHYNLDPDQEEYTRLLMTQRVKRFLKSNEREARTLLGEFWDYQLGAQVPPAEALKDFAQRAQPMLSAIHEEIVDGNLQWREILNDEQKTLHDKDLEYIDKSFKQYDDKFNRWAEGKILPNDFPGRISDKPRQVMKHEDAWEYYVRRFIQDYRLEEGQANTARSVLEEMRKEATAYRLSHKDAFAALEAEYQKLAEAKPKKDAEALAAATKKRKELDARRKKLEEPIAVGMFGRLKKKLEGIPRSDQRQAHTQRRDKLMKAAKEAREAYKARKAAETQPVKE